MIGRDRSRALIIDGVDTYKDWGLILTEQSAQPPEPKTYFVDIPSGDGSIDLTEALSDGVTYNNRKESYTFLYDGSNNNGNTFEELKSDIQNRIHGRRFDYKKTFDDEYTYTGRMSVSDVSNDGRIHFIKLDIEADPYKTKGLITNWYNISDGAMVGVKSGRKRVRPKFEFNESTIVCWDGKSYTMPSGTYTMDDVVFSEGANFITFIPANQRKFLTYKEASGYNYGDFGRKWRVYEWYRGVEKWVVSQVAFNGTGTEISGEITITATFEDDSTSSTVVTLNHPLKSADDKFFMSVVDGSDSYLLSTDVEITDSEGKVTYSQSRYGLHGELPYSYSSPVKSVSITYSGGNIVGTYETVSVADTNTHTGAVYKKVTYGEYGFGGAKEMVYASMQYQKISALTTYLASGASDTEQDIILDDGAKVTVFIEHEWSDL